MQVIGLFGARVNFSRKKAEGDGGQEVPPFGKLTLCPKVTMICSKTAEKFPQRRKRNLRFRGVVSRCSILLYSTRIEVF